MSTPLHTVRADTARRGRTVAARRRAFTLVEMMVSLAVLTLALSIVGVVFTVTTRTVNQAAAYSEVQNFARQFCLQIEEDLANVAPSDSPLVLVGRTMPAALTADDLAAGLFHRVLIGDPARVLVYDPTSPKPNPQYSDPRADILMFFTNRPSYSVAPAPSPASSYHAGGMKLAPVQVVYGHAALSEGKSGGGLIPSTWGSLRHIDLWAANGVQSIIPANEWHLARRAVIIEPVTMAATPSFTSADLGRIAVCQAGRTANGLAGDVAPLDLDKFLEELSPRSTLGATVPYVPARFRPYPSQAAIVGFVNGILYVPGPTPHHVATVFTDMPVDLRTNVGVQMLPGCAWFQVEFLMPEDPRNSLDFMPAVAVPAGLQERRWTSIEAGQTYIFVPDTLENRAAVAQQPIVPANRVSTFLSMGANNSIADRRIRMWPYAIRVTVHVYDPRGRLTDPIIRSVVHRFD